MNPTTLIFLFLPVITGVFFVEILKPKKEKHIQFLITFSGAYLFAISFLHLLPQILQNNFSKKIGLYILIGFFIQNILEFFSKGIEHGHFHKNKPLAFSIFISLCFHALLEGLPLGGHLHSHTHNTLLTGIIIHKVPVAIVLMTFLLETRMKKHSIYLLLFLFAIMAPIGAYISSNFQIFSNLQNEIIAIVIGVLLHISTTILFESNSGHKFNLPRIIAIAIGSIIALITL